MTAGGFHHIGHVTAVVTGSTERKVKQGTAATSRFVAQVRLEPTEKAIEADIGTVISMH